MKVFFQIASLSSMLIISGSALAQQANVGQPFGTGVIAPGAQEQEVDDAVHAEGPGNVDDKVHNNLADDDTEGNIRGHGKKDAPGQQ
jgi:hypothetical protein